MSKSSARKRDRRDTHHIATRSVPVSNIKYVSPSPNTYLRSIEDRRTWTPSSTRPAASFNNSQHRLIVGDPNVNTVSKRSKTPSLFESLPTKIGFERPAGVLVCVRRSIRKQVLHALKKTGVSGQKTPRFNAFSQISCRKKR